MTQPNILVIMADQLAPQFLPVYGHSVVKTPHLDKLAEQGVVFESAYCNAPLCAPARYVMMSGRLPSKIGAWDNAAELPAEIPTFAHYLSALGYRTGLSGKMHFCGPDQRHGFEERLTTDVYPADFTWTPNWDDPERHLDWYHTMDVVSNAGTCLRSSNLDYDDEVIFAAKRYLYDLARGVDTRPFCLVVSFIHPHDPYLTRPEYWNRYNDSEIDLPKVRYQDTQDDPHSARLRRAIGMDDPWPSEEQIRGARHAYYGSVSYIDEKVGELLATLKEAGVADNTMTVFTADHGDMLGERGLWYKMSWFEHSARVPLIIHHPGTISPQRISNAVSHVDLLPTLVDTANEATDFHYPTPLEGHSLVPLFSGGSGHDEVIGEYFGEATQMPLFMMRHGSMKYVRAEGDPEQLFDLNQDPDELNNLAKDADGTAFLTNLREQARSRWDVQALREQVLESQRRRQFLAPLMRHQATSWDYQPVNDASQAYIRNTLSIYEIERRSRFPPI